MAKESEIDIRQIIAEAVAPYKGMDPDAIIEGVSIDSAALLAEIVRGGIPATMGDRIKVAINVVDRVKGTPVTQETIFMREKANKMLDRIRDLESGKATLDPPPIR